MSELEADFGSAIAQHLHEESEGSLVRAYELGRQALARGFGILEIFSLLDAAQRELVLGAPPAEQARVATAVTNFFRELLSSYEMSYRGYRDANAELQRLNSELMDAYSELQAQQLQLVQAAKMASLGELVAGIAHEINNPLAFVISHLRTISTNLAAMESELTPDALAVMQERWTRVRHRLEQSEAGVERIRDLVLRLRTFSRLDEGERKPVSMRESIGSVLMILEHRCKGRVAVETSFGEPDIVDCFPSLLNQAIMNLVSNAIDAIADEGTIFIETRHEAGDYLIVVTDTGHGIPDALRDRVLEPFFTTKPIGQGTGLGLSITDSIIRQHRGKLELRAAPNTGTVATLRFPLNPSR
jgi:two-component system, NtrC family, sensor kinase